jgi:hypothetical protein
MNRRNRITLTCTLAALTVLGLTWTRAQTPPGGDMGYGGEGMYGGEYMEGYGAEMMGGGMPGGYPGMSSMGYGMGGPEPEPPGARELKARLAPVLQGLRDAADDQQKETLRRQLSSILEDYFQQDLQRRTSEIDAIEQRVQRLREQLEQRQQAKDEILQLQLKVLENETAGLGFFSRQPAAPDYGGGSMMGMEGSGGMGGGMDSGMDMGGYRYRPGTGITPLPPVPSKFQKRIAVEFLNTPLHEALDYLRDLAGANIYVDQHALKEAGIDSDAPVSMTLKDVSVATVLELIADGLSASLGARYEDDIAVFGMRISPSLPQMFLWGNDGTQPSQQTVKRLTDSFADYDFIETPLSQVLDYFSEAAEVEVFVNRRHLDEVSISMESPVTMNLQAVRPRTALRLILDSVDKSLFFSVVDGVVVVTAAKDPMN